MSAVLCRFGIHKWGFMHIYRLAPTSVYAWRCSRCGRKP